MKTKIHPHYYSKAKVACACGNTFTTGSTKEKIEVEICSKCHPFFTGEDKVIDTAGRVEKFKAKAAAAQALAEERKKAAGKKSEAKKAKAKEKDKEGKDKAKKKDASTRKKKKTG